MRRQGIAAIYRYWAIFLHHHWSRLNNWVNRQFVGEDDGFDQARMNAAQECLKRGKPITGTMHDDGTVEVHEERP